MKKSTIVLLVIIIGLALYFSFIKNSKKVETIKENSNSEVSEYNPIIDPASFVSKIDNPYYTLTPGKSFTYQGKTKEGAEKNITTVTNKTKNILGINAVEVWDRVWLDDSLIEETYDWYAQDKEGNVWYLGEDSKEYDNEKVTSTKGSWEAGVNGAKPGIIMKANPVVDDSYRQEYLKGEAEDMADVVSLTETVTIPTGTYTNCLKTRDWSQVEPDLNEYKYYCKDIGNNVLETMVSNGERTELVSFTK